MGHSQRLDAAGAAHGTAGLLRGEPSDVDVILQVGEVDEALGRRVGPTSYRLAFGRRREGAGLVVSAAGSDNRTEVFPS